MASTDLSDFSEITYLPVDSGFAGSYPEQEVTKSHLMKGMK